MGMSIRMIQCDEHAMVHADFIKAENKMERENEQKTNVPEQWQ